MKKENRKYCIGLIILIIIVIDYFYCKWIPNFIFLEDFEKEDVESYWQGVIAVFTIGMTWLTIRQTAVSYFFEKQSYRQIQKKEAVRHYQELLINAMDIFNNRYKNEIESLFAVQIVKNIIDLMEQTKEEQGGEDEVEPYQIISLDGALGILKSHLDKVLAKKRNCHKKRQDIELIIDILYRSSYYKWNKERLRELNLYNFKGLHINIAYFDKVMLENATFQEVVFCGDEGRYIWRLANLCEFDKCVFKCNFRFWWEEYCSVIIKDCEMQGLEILPKDEMSYRNKSENGKNSLNISNCVFAGFSNFSNNHFKVLQISNCKFNEMLHMHEIEVKTEFYVRDTVFRCGLDFQGSRIEYKMVFENTICKRLFYFWNSCLLKRNRIYFNDFFTDNFEMGNMSVAVYNDSHEEFDTEKAQRFSDLYEVVWNEEKELYTLNSRLKD